MNVLLVRNCPYLKLENYKIFATLTKKNVRARKILSPSCYNKWHVKILTVHTIPFSVRSAYNYDVRSDKIKYFNAISLRKTKIVYNFGLSECNRLKYQRKKKTAEYAL